MKITLPKHCLSTFEIAGDISSDARTGLSTSYFFTTFLLHLHNL